METSNPYYAAAAGTKTGSAQESDEAEAGVSFAVAEISVHCAVCEITS
jgi:hypothetical protein